MLEYFTNMVPTKKKKAPVGIFTFVLASSGFAVHGGPPPERSSGKPLWELRHPKGADFSGFTRRDLGSGRQSGVEEQELWKRWERLAAAVGVCLLLRPVTQVGETSTEVRNQTTKQFYFEWSLNKMLTAALEYVVIHSKQ